MCILHRNVQSHRFNDVLLQLAHRMMIEFQFVASLPNPTECDSSIVDVFTPPVNDSSALANALINVCTNDCGGVYSNFLKTVCNDNVGAESLQLYCTPSDTSLAAGPFCRSALAGDLNSMSTVFSGIISTCFNFSTGISCPVGCKEALIQMKERIGCCYQNVYNNTAYYTQLVLSEFITPGEFTGFVQLNNEPLSPWTRCDVKPPTRCESQPFTLPPTPLKCSLCDQIHYALTLSLPYASACGTTIGIAFLPPKNDSTAITNALETMCINDCGGIYANYLRTVCKDDMGAESINIFCTRTNGTADVGSFCY